MLFGIVEQHFKEDKTVLRVRQGGGPEVCGAGPSGRASLPGPRPGPRPAVLRTPERHGPAVLRPAEQRALASIRAGLDRLARYDDESIVHERWLMRRYDSGRYPTLGDARRATVATAWHEAGHAVAALTVGAAFRSASIHP